MPEIRLESSVFTREGRAWTQSRAHQPKAHISPIQSFTELWSTIPSSAPNKLCAQMRCAAAGADDEELCSGARGVTQAVKHSADGPGRVGRAGESHTKQPQCRAGSLQPSPAGEHQNHGSFCSAKTTGEEETPTFVPLCLHGPACCEQASVTLHTQAQGELSPGCSWGPDPHWAAGHGHHSQRGK